MLDDLPIITGAGPSGLAAALFLKKHDITARVIEAKQAFSPYSRALAVNPRSLELLESTGVTARILEQGMKINKVHFWKGNKPAVNVSLERLPHKYPFMVALSQTSSEKILAEEFEKLGGKIERGVELTAVKQSTNKIQAELKSSSGIEKASPKWLLAADGAHSKIREELGINFSGSAFKEMWYLADVPLETPWAYDSAHVRLLDGKGFIFLIPVIEDKRTQTGPIWRIITNFPNPLEALEDAKPVGKPIWESGFHISHRIADKMQDRNIYLAGDAAHIHSPLGARGMNLGIEDAYVLAELMRQGRSDKYNEFRRGIDKSVVERIKLFTTVIRGETGFTRAIRSFIPYLLETPFIFDRLAPVLTGLDHKVII